jgi:hypothetical protein
VLNEAHLARHDPAQIIAEPQALRFAAKRQESQQRITRLKQRLAGLED